MMTNSAVHAVGKNDIIGDLEILNDIINDIIFASGRKMISFCLPIWQSIGL
jgi:hypothetical protein